MHLCWGDVRASGGALDLRDGPLSGASVMAAVRDPNDGRLRCRPVGPVADRVGVVSPSVAVAVRTLVATTLRTHRVHTPYDHALARAEWRRHRIDVPSVELEAAREAVGSVAADIGAMRETVARLGGRVEALRERAGDATAASAELEDAITRLSELETERAAAEQRLSATRERARTMRDARDRRRALDDRVDNLRRRARDWLVEAGYDRFRQAVAVVAPEVEAGSSPNRFEGPDWVAALAALRLAREPGPVVVAGSLPVGDVRTVQGIVRRPVIFVEV